MSKPVKGKQETGRPQVLRGTLFSLLQELVYEILGDVEPVIVVGEPVAAAAAAADAVVREASSAWCAPVLVPV